MNFMAKGIPRLIISLLTNAKIWNFSWEITSP